MNYLKRLLIMVLLASLLAACSAQSEETVPDYGGGLNGNNFDGITLTFAMKPDICYEVDSLFGDAVRARIADVKNEFNVNIVFDEETDVAGNLFYYISSGIKPCDVLLSDSYTLHDSIRANLLYPIDTFYSGIDYLETEKWGGREKLISYAYDNHLYGILPMLWPETVWKQVDHFFFVNENIVSRLNQPDPREFVENGEWTRDRYMQVLEDYTHRNNSGDTVYALTAMPAHYFSIAIKASGIDYVVKHEDGTYSNAFFEPGALDKLTWVADSYWNNYGTSITHGTDTFTTIAQFVDESAVMVLTHLFYGLRDIQYTVENFGILPFPLSDDLAGSRWIGEFEFYNNGISFPANIYDLDAVPAVIDAIFEPLPGYETEEDRYEYYDRYVFHDPRDTRVIFECLSNCRYLPYNDNGYLIPDAINSAQGKKSISQILEANIDIMEQLNTEIYIPLEETCDLLWAD